MPRPHTTKFSRFLFLLCLTSVSIATPRAESKPASYGYRVIHIYPHDPKAFTQGLIYLDGYLYESTGLNGRSSLRKVNLQTGAVLQKYDLPAQYFGEGLTNWKNTLIQLTWKAHTGFVYDLRTFRQLRTFHFDGEGWGLTQDGAHIIMSDGNSTLRFLDPRTFQVVRRVVVSDGGVEVHNVNELEYIHGHIYANIWQTNLIAVISPADGHVLAWIDLSGLRPPRARADSDAVLNGIAFDAAHNRLFVTGKLWPKLFQIQLVRKSAPAQQQLKTAHRALAPEVWRLAACRFPPPPENATVPLRGFAAALTRAPNHAIAH